jgi:hypothetical protein
MLEQFTTVLWPWEKNKNWTRRNQT